VTISLVYTVSIPLSFGEGLGVRSFVMRILVEKVSIPLSFGEGLGVRSFVTGLLL
jgi:hypothetical protein